jgi:hypothetical protein
MSDIKTEGHNAADEVNRSAKTIEELVLGSSMDATEFLLPWIAVLLSVIVALMIKDWTAALVRGLRFKFSPAFNPGDVVFIDGDEAVIVSIGLIRTIFEKQGPRGTVWHYVANERLTFLKLEKVIKPTN